MKLNTDELTGLIATIASIYRDTNEVAALKERVLKLEHKLNEMYDMLTDFRVNQIMGAKE